MLPPSFARRSAAFKICCDLRLEAWEHCTFVPVFNRVRSIWGDPQKKKKHLGCYRLLGALVQMLAEKSGHGSFEVNRDRNADIEVSLSSGIAIYIGRAF